MNKILKLAALFCIALYLVPIPAGAEDKLPVPAMIRNPNKLDPELVQLKKLLDEGKIIPFYKSASKMLHVKEHYLDTTTTPRELADGLYLFYLITMAPLIDMGVPENLEWVANYTSLDLRSKEDVSRCVPYLAISDKNSKLEGKEEVRHFYLSAKSLMLKQFKTMFDPDFDATRKKMEQQGIPKRYLREGNEADIHFENFMNASESRNNTIRAIIEIKEYGLIYQLMLFYPTKAAEVKKYIRLAGYTDAEIPGLLDRTVGRVPEAQYLYKGLPKSRK